jgi:hypothetical protein
VVVDVAIQNTQNLFFEYFWLLDKKEYEYACVFNTNKSNSVDTVAIDLEDLSYVGEGFVINSVNLYGSVATVEYAISDFVEEEPYRQFVDDYIGLGIEEVTEAPVGIRREGNALVCNSPDVKSMRLLNLQGQIVARSTGNRLPLPMGNRLSCYIVVIQLNNKTITKKVQL